MVIRRPRCRRTDRRTDLPGLSNSNMPSTKDKFVLFLHVPADSFGYVRYTVTSREYTRGAKQRHGIDGKQRLTSESIHKNLGP
jgi:hypothetical protein